MRRTSTLSFLITLLVLQTASLSFGQTSVKVDTLLIGFDGHGKVGKWLPVRLHASGLPVGHHMELRTEFADPRGDTLTQVVDQSITDSSGAVRLAGTFRVGRVSGTGFISVIDAETSEELLRHAVSHGADVVSAAPDDPVQRTLRLRKLSTRTLMTFREIPGVEELLRSVAESSARGELLLEGVIGDADEIARSPSVLDSVDWILVTDDSEISDGCANSIRNWVSSGGRLIVSSARDIEKFCSTPLGSWVQGLFRLNATPITIRDLASVQSHVPGSRRLETNRIKCPLAVIGSDQTVTEINSLNGPIMSSLSVDGGSVTMIAVDLHRKPVSQWASLPQFYEVLLWGDRLSYQASERRQTSRISQSGVSDLATQMQASIDVVPPAGGWSTWAIMGIVGAFLFFIGPVDYLLVTHVLKRPHFTWLTFPLMIVGGVVAINTAGSNETVRTVNQLNVVDVYPGDESDAVLARSWVSLSSSVTERVDVEARADSQISSAVKQSDVMLTWNGRPEDVYGGMYREGGINLGRQVYHHNMFEPNRLQSLPLLTNGSRALAAEWHQSLETELVQSDLSVSGFGLLSGSFRHHLPCEISDWILLFGNRVYRAEPDSQVMSMRPQTVCDAGANTYATDLKTVLNGSRLVATNENGNNKAARTAAQVVTRYDSGSTDDRYIMAMTSFYEAAGGASYVGLSQTQLRSLEVSDTIRLNHAILIGRADWHPTSLHIGEASISPRRNSTIVRLFLPVDRRPSAERARTKSEIEEAERKRKEAEEGRADG